MATSIARPALLPPHALTIYRASYCRYGQNTAGVQPRQPAAICAGAALDASSQLLLQGQRDCSKSSHDAERIVVHYSPLACSCYSCRLLLMTHLATTRVATRLTPQPAPVPASGLVRRKPGRPKGSKNKKQSSVTPLEKPEKVPVVAINPATNTPTEKLEDSIYPTKYQEYRLAQGGAGQREMHRSNVPGIEWGVFELMCGKEKPQSCTDHYHYIIFVLRGHACLTLGDGYTVRCTDIPLAEGYAVEVERGNDYSIRNTDASLPAAFLYLKTRGPAHAAPYRAA